MEDYIITRRGAAKAAGSGDPLRYDAVRAVCAVSVNIYTPPAAVDGVSLRVGDRLLLTQQTNAETNGIWLYMPRLVRPDDFPNGATVQTGAAVHVSEGLMYGGQRFRLTAAVVVGAAAQNWVSCGAADARLDALPPRTVLITDENRMLTGAVGRPGQVLSVVDSGAIEFVDLVAPLPVAEPFQSLSQPPQPPLTVLKTDLHGTVSAATGRPGQALRIAADGTDVVFADAPPPPPLTVLKTNRAGVPAAISGRPGQVLRITDDGSDIVFADAPGIVPVFAAVATALLDRAGETSQTVAATAPLDARVCWGAPDLINGAMCDGGTITLPAAGVYEISLTGTFYTNGIASTSSFLEAHLLAPGGPLLRRFVVSAFHRAAGTAVATCCGTFTATATAPRCCVRVYAYRSAAGNDLVFSPANTSVSVRLLKK